MSLSFSAFVHAIGSSLPALTAMLQALCTAPGGHVLHFCASSEHAPDVGPGCGAVAATAVIVTVAVAVAVAAVAVEADDGAGEGESPELLLQAPARKAPTSTTTSFLGRILRQSRAFRGS